MIPSALDGREPALLMPGTSSFYHFPRGEYSVSNDGTITLHFGPNDLLKLRPEHVFIVKSVPPQHHLDYPANFWHNPQFLPNGMVNKFFDEAYLKQITWDRSLVEELDHHARKDAGDTLVKS